MLLHDSLVVVLACAFLGPAGLGRAADPAPHDPATQAAMHDIFQALSALLPGMLSEGTLGPEERSAAAANLDTIAARADSVATHSGSQDPAFAFTGESLAEDARRAKRRFAGGRILDARWEVLHLTDACVACHSRQPSDKDAAFAKKLIGSVDVAQLPPRQRARLAVATRQFDRASAIWEELLLSPPPPDGEIARAVDLTEYLIVTVRVERDPARAAKLLEKLKKRSETAGDTRRLIGPWLVTLREKGKLLQETPSLASGRALAGSGRDARPYPFSRAGLMDDLLASAVLHRWLSQSASAPAHDRAEAYYLLGLTDAQVRTSPWLSDSAWYLETAIRTEPNSRLAEQAFEAYEDMVLLEWSGSAGTRVPDDVQQYLDRLRALAVRSSV